MAVWLRDVVAQNQQHIRLLGPDETESNKLAVIYKAGKKVLTTYLPEDEDGGEPGVLRQGDGDALRTHSRRC
jgi:xylulose-5-phosphate/fructose-6-phosphate phosphoketolase